MAELTKEEAFRRSLINARDSLRVELRARLEATERELSEKTKAAGVEAARALKALARVRDLEKALRALLYGTVPDGGGSLDGISKEDALDLAHRALAGQPTATPEVTHAVVGFVHPDEAARTGIKVGDTIAFVDRRDPRDALMAEARAVVDGALWLADGNGSLSGGDLDGLRDLLARIDDVLAKKGGG